MASDSHGTTGTIGSVFEFGLRYQLTSTDYSEAGNTLFSTRNILENLYNYFFHAFVTISNFPFVRAAENIGTNERMVGLLVTVPFVLLALIAPMILIHKLLKISDTMRDNDRSGLLNGLILCIGITTVINFAVILLYYYAAMRFLVDAMPSLLLLSTFGFWRGYQGIQSTIIRVLLAAPSGLLVIISIISSTLFTMALSANRLVVITRMIKYVFLTFK